jgi:hypothetical protein
VGLAGGAQVGLIDRGNGLIYDTVLDITWIQAGNFCGTNPTDPGCIAAGADANGAMTWSEAVFWANNLVYAGYDNWRLPTLGPIGAAFDYAGSNNATTDNGWAKTTTGAADGGWRDGAGDPVYEMGHMYYVDLANLGSCTPNDASPGSCSEQASWGSNNTSFIDALTGDTVSFCTSSPPTTGPGWRTRPIPTARGTSSSATAFMAPRSIRTTASTRGLCAPAMSPPPRCLARRC